VGAFAFGGCSTSNSTHPDRVDGGAPFTQRAGARAFSALASVAGADDATVGAPPMNGSATFRATTAGVDLTLSFTGCVFNTFYAVQLYDASSCDDAVARIARGDDRGRDGVPSVSCTGTSGFALVRYSRENGDALPWTIGDAPSPTNLVGRALVIQERDAPTRALACGMIARGPDDPAADAGGAAIPPVTVSAELAGYCAFSSAVPSGALSCATAQKAVDCANVHCDLAGCLGVCADHVACVEGQPDACAASGACEPSSTCATCIQDLENCMIGFCFASLACAVPTPGGPCSKLEACCNQQGKFAEECLDGIHGLETLGGDLSCSSAMNDWDFNAHLAVPCQWDGG
jgi:hypothetical protein